MTDCLAAALLYTATHFSLLRLLRHPRNWWPPLAGASIATAVLAGGTLAWVAAASEPFDMALLAVSAILMVLWFAAAAAPALDFRPSAPKPVHEWLARHSEHAGLWVGAPAALSLAAWPEPALAGFVGAAMALEFAWYLRTRPPRVRPRLPLTQNDQDVLQTLAGGDVDGFVDRFGIRELVRRPDGGYDWLGCTGTSAPCPFNYYMLRLGLNTAPCCRAHLETLALYVADQLVALDAVHWLDGGTLLGAARDNGQLLAWEDDVDFGVLLDEHMTWERLTAHFLARGRRDRHVVDVFPERGYLTVSLDAPQPRPLRWQRNRMRGEIRLDLVPYWHDIADGRPVLYRRTPKGSMTDFGNGRFGVPADMVLPPGTLRFLDRSVPVPAESEDYLRTIYGAFETVDFMYVDAKAAAMRQAALARAQNRPAMEAGTDG